MHHFSGEVQKFSGEVQNDLRGTVRPQNPVMVVSTNLKIRPVVVSWILCLPEIIFSFSDH